MATVLNSIFLPYFLSLANWCQLHCLDLQRPVNDVMTGRQCKHMVRELGDLLMEVQAAKSDGTLSGLVLCKSCLSVYQTDG